ncbi:MAG: class I SAM-dependent methyltransferase [Candidatus Magasanikbacteria bacterium]|nr:class I SAM-dependent methyltransferase [Candidatus Magasanikbacteria bacterium]
MHHNEINFEEKNKQLFNRWARWYDAGINRIFFESIYRRTISILKRERQAELRRIACRFLDVACGTGEIIYRLAREFPETQFDGVDFTTGMIKKAQEKTRALHNVSFQEADVAILPFPDNSFDVILCSDAFHHLPQPEIVLKEVNRILKKGGLFLLVDPACEGLFPRLIFNNLFKWIEHAHHYYRRTELRKLFARHGFKVTDIFTYYFQNFLVSKK